MTRLGWTFLALVVLGGAAFVAMTRFGGSVGLPKTTPGRTTTAAEPADALPALAVPVSGIARGSVVDTWGQARGEGRVHHGTDIPALANTPVLAAADGTIEKLFQSQLGGTTIYERSPDRRWTFYYAHLAGYASGLAEGQAVKAGQVIGFVGDTGDAGPGNYHLHFGLERTTPDQRWYQGEDVNAYPLLARAAPAR